MSNRNSEYRRAAELATRTAGLRVIAARVGRRKGEIVARITIGPHSEARDARAFVSTLTALLQNQDERTTDYDQWCFLCAGDGKEECYFKVAPIDYYERYGEADFDPRPYFQLPDELGFQHHDGSTFAYKGDEQEGRLLLLRLGMKETF